MVNARDKFLEKVTKIINNDTISRKLVTKVGYLLCNKEKDVELSKNSLIIKSSNNIIRIMINGNTIEYNIKTKEESIVGKFTRCKECSMFKEKKDTADIINYDNGYYIYNKFEYTDRLYDTNNKEMLRKDEKYTTDITKTDGVISYGKDHNKKECNTYFRLEDNTIIRRELITQNKEVEENTYIRPDTNELLNICASKTDLYYYGIDNEVFDKYLEGESSVEDLHINLKSKKYHMPNIQYI